MMDSSSWSHSDNEKKEDMKYEVDTLNPTEQDEEDAILAQLHPSIKALMNLSKDKPIPPSRTREEVLEFYGLPPDFNPKRKIGDRSHCTCAICLADYPKRVQTASFHQDKMVFVMPNAKPRPRSVCSSNALTAILYSCQKSPTQWTCKDMNKILVTGDRLHSKLLQELHLGRNGIVRLEDLIRKVNLNGKCIDLTESTPPHSGNLYIATSDCEDFNKVVDRMKTNKSKGMIVKCLSYCIAIMKEDNGYYLFDSHARDEGGLPDANGLASLYYFKEASHIETYLERFVTEDIRMKNETMVESDEMYKYMFVKTKSFE